MHLEWGAAFVPHEGVSCLKAEQRANDQLEQLSDFGQVYHRDEGLASLPELMGGLPGALRLISIDSFWHWYLACLDSSDGRVARRMVQHIGDYHEAVQVEQIFEKRRIAAYSFHILVEDVLPLERQYAAAFVAASYCIRVWRGRRRLGSGTCTASGQARDTIRTSTRPRRRADAWGVEGVRARARARPRMQAEVPTCNPKGGYLGSRPYLRVRIYRPG